MSHATQPHTPTGKLARQYAQAVEQLHRSREEFDHFVRALSHDMSANFMLLEHSFGRLKGEVDAQGRPELEELVGHVDACLRESKRFLDDLVGLARTGCMEMDPADVPLEEVVDEVLFEQRSLLAERAVEVRVHRPLPAVGCNRHRLKQIVANLVRNAVRHGCDERRPRITVSAAGVDAPGGAGKLVELAIHDNGRGIDPRHHEEVFLPGRRLPQARGEGTGMGLAIVRKIAEYYGGTVRLDPSGQSGTRMLVTLPPAKPSTPLIPPLDSSLHLSGPDGRCLEHDSPHSSRAGPPHSFPSFA